MQGAVHRLIRRYAKKLRPAEAWYPMTHLARHATRSRRPDASATSAAAASIRRG
jgi:hypothetical protein